MRVELLVFILHFCQAQSQPQHSWTELALISLLDLTGPTRTGPTRTGPERPGIVSRCSSRLAFATFKGTRGLLRSASFTKPNHTYQTEPNQTELNRTEPNQPNQTKPTKPNLPNKTYQTEPTKHNLPNQAYYTKSTKPNLLYKTYQTKSKSSVPKLALSLAQLSPNLFHI